MLCNGVFCKKKICLSWLYHSLHYLTPSHSPISLDPITQHILFQFSLPPTHLIFSSLSLTTFSHHSLPHIVTPPTPSHLTHTTSYNSPKYLNTSHSTLSLAPFPTPSPTLSSNNLVHFTHHQIIAPFSSFFCSTISLTHLTHPSVPTLTRLSHLQHSLPTLTSHSLVSFFSPTSLSLFQSTPPAPWFTPFTWSSQHSLAIHSPSHSYHPLPPPSPNSTHPLTRLSHSPHYLLNLSHPLTSHSPLSLTPQLSPLSLTPLASPFSPHSLGPLTMLSLLTPPPFPPSHYPTITLTQFSICFVQFTYPTLSPYFVCISH